MTTLEILLTYAVKAPSSHNTQPWRFRIEEPTRVFVYADRTRQLPVNDPRDRELTISCGAAIENLAIASREFGFDVGVRVLPEPGDRDLMAIVTLAEGSWPSDDEGAIFMAIDQRRTYRTAFSRLAVDPQIVRAMGAAAEAEGAWLAAIGEPRRSRVAALVQEGDRRQFHNPHWRRELASWLRPRRRGDGLALPRAASLVARTVVRALDVGRRTGIRDAALAATAPVLAVLGTDADDTRSWVAAGRALERVLLTAAFKGVQAGFLNQPCQIDELRGELQILVGGGVPQALLRFGYPLAQLPASARKPLASMIDDRPEGLAFESPVAPASLRAEAMSRLTTGEWRER